MLFSILLSVALKSTAVLGAAWLLAWALRGRSAAARHLVWTAAAAAVLALPFLSVSLPALDVPASGVLLDPGVVFRASGAAGNGTAAVIAAPAPALAAAPAASAAAWRPNWRTWFLLLWAAGAAAAFAGMLFAGGAVWRVRRAARPFPDRDLARALAAALGIQRQVEVLETRRGGMPMTFGLWRPAIFMPAEAAEWSEERRRIVLLHEMGHVRRGDAATHVMARAALSLYWWNPLAWTAWRQFLKERERATDDLVLNAGARASDYAGHLLEVARTMQSVPATAWAAVAMARRSELEGRLLAILDSGVNRKQPGRAAALIVALLAVGLAAPLAAVRAQARAEQAVSPEVDATIRAAVAQKNHEILENAAAAFEKQRKYDEAKKLREAALAIREQLSGQQSLDYAAGLMKLGDLARQRGKHDEALAFYAKAVALGDRPEVAAALLHLGIDAYRSTDPVRCQDFLQRARNVAPTGALMGQAMTWMAMVQVPEAESLFQSALSMEDPSSPEAALTMELYADFLSGQGRAVELESMKARAGAIRKAHIAELSPKQTAASEALKVSGAVSVPKLLHKLEPSYSPEARAMKVAGTVVLAVTIGTDGNTYDVQLVKGVGFGLDEEALNAVAQWKFSPGTRGGMPVPVRATIEVNFRLM